jgi:hypothetical protein
VVRGSDRIDYERERYRPRNERESSVASVDSQDGLLNGSGTNSRTSSPPPFISPATSPVPPVQAVPDLMASTSTPTMSSTTSGESIGNTLAHPQPKTASRHKPTGSIVAQRKKALEEAMGGLDVNGKR